MLEASVRDVERTKILSEACKAMHWMMSNLLISCKSQHSATIPACISLAATVRKLIWISLQPAAGVTQLQQRHSHYQPNQQEEQLQERVRLARLVNHCMVVIQALDQLKLCAGLKEVPVSSRSKLQHASNNMPTVISSPSGRGALHRLETVILVNWVQLDCHSVFSGQGLSQRHVHPSVHDALHRLGTLSDGLNDAVRTVLQATAEEEITPTSEARIDSGCQDSVWERYALTHFHGRLLPGCCYLDCTNLGGVSEEALTTQLCSVGGQGTAA